MMNETLLTRAEESIQHGLALLLMSSYGITEAEAKQTVTRIADMIQHSDEPRFSLYDYVDALANWNDPLDIRALMKSLRQNTSAASMLRTIRKSARAVLTFCPTSSMGTCSKMRRLTQGFCTKWWI